MRNLLLIIIFLKSYTILGQVTITYSVDISNYLASGAIVGENGIRIGGNFSDLNTSLPNWTPSAFSCGMTNINSNIWTISVTYPNSSIGLTQYFKFVNNDWGTNELGSNEFCFQHDGSGNANRYFLIPNSDTSICFNWDGCNPCSITTSCKEATNPIISSQVFALAVSDTCGSIPLFCKPSFSAFDWSYQWKKNGNNIAGADTKNFIAPSTQDDAIYSCTITCPDTNFTIESNSFLKDACFNDVSSSINYLLVQNVTTTGNNASNKTIQVQFDLSWGNTWWDDINWDAAWVFMKYKTASGEWKHAKINPAGYDHGQGSPNIIQPTSDKMGAFVRLGLKGQGNFNAAGMQLQWNYGLDGLTNVNGLEVKVFAIEMVYQPQGDFSLSTNFKSYDINYSPESGTILGPGNNIAVVNSRLSPVLSVNGLNFKIKGDAGLDLNTDGTIDNQAFSTGYRAFYLFKYELSEQQYADFLNCLNPTQIGNLGIAGNTISLNQGAYFASSPNRACNGANPGRLLAYADWTGLRPMTVFEFNKAFNGPNPPNPNCGKCSDCGGNPPENASGNQGYGYFGCKDLIGNVWEPIIRLGTAAFVPNNGDGVLQDNGFSDQTGWTPDQIRWANFNSNYNQPNFCSGQYDASKGFGFRLCRSAE